MEHFQIGEAIKFGWEKFKAHFLFLWLTLGVVAGISILTGYLEKAVEEEEFISFAVSLGSIFITMILELGLIRLYLTLIDTDQESKLAELFSEYRLFWRYLGGTILYVLMVILGLILLILPGIYLALKYQFFVYLLVDKNLGVFESLQTSARMTEGEKWQLFGLSLALLALNIAGALALLIGLLVTIPVSALAFVFVYRKLSKRLEQGVTPVTPAPVVAASTPAPPVPPVAA